MYANSEVLLAYSQINDTNSHLMRCNFDVMRHVYAVNYYQASAKEATTATIMGKLYTRISIPVRHPLKMLDMTSRILDRHTKLGVNSPLEGTEEIVELANIYPLAKEKHDEGGKLHSLGEAAIQGARLALGRDRSQTINDKGTVYFYMGRIRVLLQLFYQGMEEEISTFGFQVVVNTNSGRKYVSISIPSNSIRDIEELADKIIKRHEELGNDSPPKDTVDMAHFESQYLLATAKRSEGNNLKDRCIMSIFLFDL